MSSIPAARVLDGAALARRIREEVRAAAAELARGGRMPFLRVILLGHDPASETYVASKTSAAREAGCGAETVRLPSGTSPAALLAEVARANRDPSVDGVLVQLPLEPGHDPRRVFDAIDPWKDVDGVHPDNVGRLHQGRARFVPCTPAGILRLLDAYEVPISGRRAVVLGRSDIVGKPVAALLTSRDATVTLCHSKTPDLARVCREADILVAALGRPGFVGHEHVKPGAAVVDVGINRLTRETPAPPSLLASARVRRLLDEKGRALVGDVDFDAVSPVAGFVSPVPGGIGPLTVAMLLANTVLAAKLGRERRERQELDPLTL
jgi:methylenetetrahydrofolate dehydrogenase (NADP+)/methenyltetrahydrofolate cyclohydrolase